MISIQKGLEDFNELKTTIKGIATKANIIVKSCIFINNFLYILIRSLCSNNT